MKKLMFILFFAGMTLATVHAQDSETAPGEPVVTIREDDEGTQFHEYRVNGVIAQIKVVPARGPEYYLVPADGGGWIRHDRPQLLVPSWKLLEW
jgi:hypothetical protein